MRRHAYSLVAMLFAVVVGCGQPPAAPPPSVTRTPGVEVTDAAPAVDLARDWPWWRGPSRNGVAACETAPTEWDDSKNVLWTVPVPGRGHSSPTVCGDAVYLTTADETSQRQMVLAFDRATGEKRWEKVVSEGAFPTAMHEKSTHANGSVACDGERVFAAFLHHDAIWLYALGLDGEKVWELRVGDFESEFGYAPSPAIFGSAVLVAGDGKNAAYLAAVDRVTGKPAWKADRATRATYSSPLIANVAGKDQAVLTGANLMASYDPRTGEELWRLAGGSGTTCGTPTFDENRIYASGGYPENETWAVAADGSTTKVWSTPDRCYEPSLLCAKGLLFSVNDDGIAICWDAASGEERWKARVEGKFSGSPVFCGDHVYVTSDTGTTYVFQATGEEYAQVSANQLGSDAYATPTICGGRIYLRYGAGSGAARQERLVCIGEPEA